VGEGFNFSTVGSGCVVGLGFMIGRLRGVIRSGLMIRSRLMVGRGWGVVWSRCMIWGRGVVRCRFVVGCGFVVGCRGRMVRLGKGGVVNLSSAVDAVLVVTCAQVFVEDGAVPALKSVLLAVGVTEMVDLASSLRISIMSVWVWHTSAVKLAVSLGYSDGNWLHRLDLVGPLLQEHRTNGLLIGRLGRRPVTGRFSRMIIRLGRRMIRINSVVIRLWWRSVRIRMIVRSVRRNIGGRSRCIGGWLIGSRSKGFRSWVVVRLQLQGRGITWIIISARAMITSLLRQKRGLFN